MSLIDYGINPLADKIVQEVVEGGRAVETGDVTVLAQEVVRLTKDSGFWTRERVEEVLSRWYNRPDEEIKNVLDRWEKGE